MCIETFRIELKSSTGAAEFFRIYLNEFEKKIELDQCRINYSMFT